LLFLFLVSEVASAWTLRDFGGGSGGGINGDVTAVAVGQRQRIYSGVRTLTWFYLSSINIDIKFVAKGSKTNLSHWHVPYGRVMRGGVPIQKL
jgi:hypothetical protein